MEVGDDVIKQLFQGELISEVSSHKLPLETVKMLFVVDNQHWCWLWFYAQHVLASQGEASAFTDKHGRMLLNGGTKHRIDIH